MDRAEHYRKQAERLRTLAEGMNDQTIKDQMLKLAEGYERMARRAEQSPQR